MATALYIGVSAISAALVGGVLWWRFRPADASVGVTKGEAAATASSTKSMAVASFSYLLSDYKPELVPVKSAQVEQKSAIPEKLAALPTQEQIEKENEATNQRLEEAQVARREQESAAGAAVENGEAPAPARPEPVAAPTPRVEAVAGPKTAAASTGETVAEVAKIALDNPISDPTGKPNDTHNRAVESKIASDRSKRKLATSKAFSRSANPAVQTPVPA